MSPFSEKMNNQWVEFSESLQSVVSEEIPRSPFASNIFLTYFIHVL